VHTFEYVEPHIEAEDISGMVRSFWYHLVVVRLMGDGMQKSGEKVSGQRWV